MMTEDRPYAGILMNDGTEISHYGVKGMKWGKKIFGKVKGLFGIPEGPHAKTHYRSDTSKITPESVLRKTAGKTPKAPSQRRKSATGLHEVGWHVERDDDGHPFYSQTKKGKNYNPTRKTKK